MTLEILEFICDAIWPEENMPYIVEFVNRNPPRRARAA
jgi:hypothetical protein